MARGAVLESRGSGSLKLRDRAERAENDYYPTPPAATLAFLLAEEPRLRRFPLIWEPAAGHGAMVDVMAAEGYRVHASDLVDRGRGFEVRGIRAFERAPAPAMVTNPPFLLANDGTWIWEYVRLRLDYMALLLPLEFFATRRGYALFQGNPPARLWQLGWKVDFTGGGSPVSNHQWAVWDRERAGLGTVVDVLARPPGVSNVPPEIEAPLSAQSLLPLEARP